MNAIYIGKGFIRKFKDFVYIEEVGHILEANLNYGMTGTVFYVGGSYYSDEDSKQINIPRGTYDFRPSGMNICFYLKKKDLFFIK